jgi:hypothetical protein
LEGPQRAALPLVLDSPHSGRTFPADFNAAVSEAELREGEDSFVDELWAGAVELGAPLLCAQWPRTYLDPNRHTGDVDLELIEGPWPGEYLPSGKAKFGKALVWRTLEDGRSIYSRKLKVEAIQNRIQRYHAPYHEAIQKLLNETHARFGKVYHINKVEDLLEMARRENVMMSMPHPRTKGSTGFPDAIKELAPLNDAQYHGFGFRWGMGLDLSEQRLCEYRCLPLIDDMSNWYVNKPIPMKTMLSISEVRYQEPYDEIYSSSPVTYVKLDRLPNVDDTTPPALWTSRNTGKPGCRDFARAIVLVTSST